MKTIAVPFLIITLLFNPLIKAQNVSKDSLPDSLIVKKEIPAFVPREKGYFNSTRLGIGFRMGQPVLTASTVNGYQFSHHISLGLGIGYLRAKYPLWSYRFWFTIGKVVKSESSATVNQVNIFIEQTFTLGNKKVFPFLFYDLGYSFCIEPTEHELTSQERSEWLIAEGSHSDDLIKTSYTAGFYFSPGVGIRIPLHKNTSFNFSLQLNIAMYTINSTYLTHDYQEDYEPGNKKINLYPLFNIGIGF